MVTLMQLFWIFVCCMMEKTCFIAVSFLLCFSVEHWIYCDTETLLKCYLRYLLLMEKGDAFTLGLGFLGPYPSLKSVRMVNVVMRLFKKKDEAVKNWRSRAMLIDLHKTRLTIVNT